jgi:hypothetical protein
MASWRENPILHPIRDWRYWVIGFGAAGAAIYGSQPVAEATGHFAFALLYIAVVSVLMFVGFLWANRRDNERGPLD